MQTLSTLLSVELVLALLPFLERNYGSPGTTHILGAVRCEVSENFPNKA